MNKIIDLTKYEEEDKFLEGTGSIVFDYEGVIPVIQLPDHKLIFLGKVAYACESVRTNADVLCSLCSQINYEPVIMQANDKQGDYF